MKKRFDEMRQSVMHKDEELLELNSKYYELEKEKVRKLEEISKIAREKDYLQKEILQTKEKFKRIFQDCENLAQLLGEAVDTTGQTLLTLVDTIKGISSLSDKKTQLESQVDQHKSIYRKLNDAKVHFRNKNACQAIKKASQCLQQASRQVTSLFDEAAKQRSFHTDAISLSRVSLEMQSVVSPREDRQLFSVSKRDDCGPEDVRLHTSAEGSLFRLDFNCHPSISNRLNFTGLNITRSKPADHTQAIDRLITEVIEMAKLTDHESTRDIIDRIRRQSVYHQLEELLDHRVDKADQRSVNSSIRSEETDPAVLAVDRRIIGLFELLSELRITDHKTYQSICSNLLADARFVDTCTDLLHMDHTLSASKPARRFSQMDSLKLAERSRSPGLNSDREDARWPASSSKRFDSNSKPKSLFANTIEILYQIKSALASNRSEGEIVVQAICSNHLFQQIFDDRSCRPDKNSVQTQTDFPCSPIRDASPSISPKKKSVSKRYQSASDIENTNSMNRRDPIQLEPASKKQQLEPRKLERAAEDHTSCYLDEKLRSVVERMKSLEELMALKEAQDRDHSMQTQVPDDRMIDCCCEYEMLKAAIDWLRKTKAETLSSDMRVYKMTCQGALQYVQTSLKHLTQITSITRESFSPVFDSSRNQQLREIMSQTTRLQIVLNHSSQQPPSSIPEEKTDDCPSNAAAQRPLNLDRAVYRRLRRLAKHSLHSFQLASSVALKKISSLCRHLPKKRESISQQLQRLIARSSQNMAQFSGLKDMDDFEEEFDAHLSTQEQIADDLTLLVCQLVRAAVGV